MAFHRKYAVGGDDLEAIVFVAVFFEHPPQIPWVAVAVEPRDRLFGNGATEPHAVNDARVVELVAVNNILIVRLAEVARIQRGEERLVGGEAGRMQDRRLATDEPRDPPLQLQMNQLCPTHDADAA